MVSVNQFSFVKGKQMLDCSLIANEVIDKIKHKGTRGLLLKVDFEKAYDNVDWSFLELVMTKIRFKENWKKWIMACVSMASLSVLVNGAPT